MATEFQMYPAGIIETCNTQHGISTLTFPRLTTKQCKSVGNSRAIPLQHYTGLKKVIPPSVPADKHTGISYVDVCAQHASLLAAQEKDTQWLNSLSQRQDAMEWNGFNNQLSRNQGALKPTTFYMFGPLIDAPPSHPNTIFTTLTYMQTSLVDMGMEKVHVSMDMQLFVVTKQVCWHQPMRFHNVIVHPGGMHIIVIHKLHCEVDEGFGTGSVCVRGIWGANRYLQWEVLGKSHVSLSWSFSCTLEAISINWTKDI